MPITHRIDPSLEILVIRAEGSPTMEEQRAVYERFRADPAYRPGMPMLIDNRLRITPAKPTDVREFARAISVAPRELEGVRCALLVARDVQYGMSRMFGTLVNDSGVSVRVFRDEAEAVAWLRE